MSLFWGAQARARGVVHAHEHCPVIVKLSNNYKSWHVNPANVYLSIVVLQCFSNGSFYLRIGVMTELEHHHGPRLVEN